MTPGEVVARAAQAALDRPLASNAFRGVLVEAMVAGALRPRWRWCGMDWTSWDFERDDGVRLEVKQSAARQSWHAPDAAPSAASYTSRRGRGGGSREGGWRSPAARRASTCSRIIR